MQTPEGWTMPDFDLDSPEERGTPVLMPDGRVVVATSESKFYRNILRYLHRTKRDGKTIGPPNADLLHEWAVDDLRPGSDGSPSWASKIARNRSN